MLIFVIRESFTENSIQITINQILLVNNYYFLYEQTKTVAPEKKLFYIFVIVCNSPYSINYNKLYIF